jgi:hypothetical protein
MARSPLVQERRGRLRRTPVLKINQLNPIIDKADANNTN